jgi:hypothetical protein
MAVVSVAITLSFHLKSQPSQIERKMAKPLGAVFWVLSVATLFVGLGNYISKTYLNVLAVQRTEVRLTMNDQGRSISTANGKLSCNRDGRHNW